MKTFLLLILGLIVSSQAFGITDNMNDCQTALTEFVSIPHVLNACGLSQLTQKFAISEDCMSDLSKASDILKKVATQNNKAKMALELTLLKNLYTKKVQKSCHFLNVVNIQPITNPSNSSGVCLEAAYQLSLDVQTMWQHVKQGNYPAAFASFEKLLDDTPNTLDTCGDHALADKIRKQFPAACLRSLDKLAKEISKIEHNFDHLQWLVKNWKEIGSTFNNVRKSCPVFA